MTRGWPAGGRAINPRQGGRGYLRQRDGRECFVYLDILERDNSSRLLVGRVLEIVQAVVVEDEPASLPRLVAAAFHQSTFQLILT